MNNLIGQKFGRLTVLKRMDNDKHRNSMWLCRCDCGKEKIICGYDLKRGHTQGCGCLRKEIAGITHTTHGHYKTKTYKSWEQMIQRCTNPKVHNYHNYGGRGITICSRWMKFENFLEDMGERPGKNHSIDRINNNGNYCKSNCRWATIKQQNRNRRDNLYFTYKNKTQLLIEWSEETGILYTILYYRIFRSGWTIEKALTTPIKKRRK
ncbi:hypothetical protein LCGC14_1829790 [marine sediment metagenome]|uniref:AP2/ERF domain-containing protein n=1 Tax=marine sediment metagenome TaxID=412755 RepID=A0A0F9GGP6_9ZZZZ